MHTNNSARILTGGMEGCPQPEAQTCHQPSNCRGNVFNECEIQVFINLSLFFAFSFVILTLLTFQVINCKQYYQKDRNVNVVSTIIHLPVIVYLCFSLVEASNSLKFLFGSLAEQSKFYIIKLERESEMLVNTFAIPSALVSIVTNTVLHAYLWH